MASRYIDGSYRATNPTYHVEDSPWKARQIVEMIERQGLTSRTLSEVGCGAGAVLEWVTDQLPNVEVAHGFEISPEAINLARQRQRPGLEFFLGDLVEGQEITAALPHYDLVLCVDVFEHVPNYFGFLKALRRLGEHFVFHIPLDLSVQMLLRVKPLRRVRAEVGHLHYFTLETALTTLEDAGYAVEAWSFTPAGIDRPRSRLARIARFPRRVLFALTPELTVRILGGYSLLVHCSKA